MKTIMTKVNGKYKYRIQESDSGNYEVTCTNDDSVSLTFGRKAFKTLKGATNYGERYFNFIAN